MVNLMKRFANIAKSALLIALFGVSFAFAGCSADTLTGPETPQQAQDCDNCSSGHNL
jgi:hypothetical protein